MRRGTFGHVHADADIDEGSGHAGIPLGCAGVVTGSTCRRRPWRCGCRQRGRARLQDRLLGLAGRRGARRRDGAGLNGEPVDSRGAAAGRGACRVRRLHPRRGCDRDGPGGGLRRARRGARGARRRGVRRSPDAVRASSRSSARRRARASARRRAAAGEALVEVTAAPLNPTEIRVASGSFARRPQPPYVPGLEGAGRVVESDRVSPGRRVRFEGAALPGFGKTERSPNSPRSRRTHSWSCPTPSTTLRPPPWAWSASRPRWRSTGRGSTGPSAFSCWVRPAPSARPRFSSRVRAAPAGSSRQDATVRASRGCSSSAPTPR